MDTSNLIYFSEQTEGIF